MRNLILHIKKADGVKTSRQIRGALAVPLEAESIGVGQKSGMLSLNAKYLWYFKEKLDPSEVLVEMKGRFYAIAKVNDYSLLGFYEYALSAQA